MRSLGMRFCTVAICACLAVGSISPLGAQKGFLEDLKLDPAATAGTDEEAVTVSASFTIDPDGQNGKLSITAEMGTGYHVYSITQPEGGPIRTKIKLEANNGFDLIDDFKPVEPPAEHLDKIAFPGVVLEEHEGTVIWTAAIRFARGVEPANLAIAGKLYAQACNAEHCNPPTDFPFTAKLATALPSVRRNNASANGERQPLSEKTVALPSTRTPPVSKGLVAEDVAGFGEYTGDKQVMFRAYIEPKVVEPGGKTLLVVTAEPNQDSSWHIYAAGNEVPNTGNKPTLIVLTVPSGLVPGDPVADVEAVKGADESLGYYDAPVTWTTELVVPKDAKPGTLTVVGIVGYQTCTDSSCLQPTAVGFEAHVSVGREAIEGQSPVTFTGKRSYDDAKKAKPASRVGVDLKQIKRPAEDADRTSLMQMMLFGFAGGLILNLMPCVLPVIGLKVLSFIEQGGHDRRRILLLNVWYSLGMLAVFMVLATLPVAFRLLRNEDFGWGQQFAYDGFNITLAAVVFVMALSFLGIWEIPIPGFVGGGKVGELATKEGFSGAFAKGAVTTVLATPCSGPFLGSALAFAFAQPAPVTYTIFGCIGLGMASPYLLIGAFPSLVGWLPKPGAWMDTFKQMMGFVLLATVVYILTFVRSESCVPALSLLMGLWAACWWIGRTPLYAELPKKLRAWAGASFFAVLVGLFSFQWLGPVMHGRVQRMIDEQIARRLDGTGTDQAPIKDENELPWQQFSMAALERFTAEGKTVLIDFTADWCLTCKTLESTVLNTARTREYVQENDIVTMVGDVTHFPPETSELLETLSGGRQVPVLAIFPGTRPNEPIVLRDAYTPGLLFEKLKEAGPSKGAPGNGATAMKTSP